MRRSECFLIALKFLFVLGVDLQSILIDIS
jgi:hypothetical protein